MTRNLGLTICSWPAVFFFPYRVLTPRGSWSFDTSNWFCRGFCGGIVLGIVRAERCVIPFHAIFAWVFIVAFYLSLPTRPASRPWLHSLSLVLMICLWWLRVELVPEKGMTVLNVKYDGRESRAYHNALCGASGWFDLLHPAWAGATQALDSHRSSSYSWFLRG